MSEFVYILTNPTMRDLVKIGFTCDSIEKRMRELSNHAGVPVPFECAYCCEVAEGEGAETEKLIHDAFNDHRINPRREFFRINPERVKSALKLREVRDVTPNQDIVGSEEEQQSLNRERKRRENFTFPMLQIPEGSEIVLTRDNVTKVAKVVGDKEVEYEGERHKLSPLTRDIFQKELGLGWTAVSGSDYWSFEGETLTDRRIRIENSSD